MADLNQNVSTGKGLAILGVGCLACILFFLFTGGNGCTSNTRPPERTPESILGPGPAGPSLQVEESSMSRTSPGHCTVVGRVKNISDAPIDNIRVIAYIKDAGGKTLATDRGLVEYSPLAPGQVSPFRAIVRYEGSSESSAQIEFSANGAQVKFK